MLFAVLFSRILRDSISTSDACDASIQNCRQLSDIVTSCLTTIFAATWVSVHPNVPPPQDGILKSTLRRLGMMFIAVIAPELIVFFAARQLHAALDFSKNCSVSLTHGFFLSMGGFVSQDGRRPITTMAQLRAEPGYRYNIRETPRDDILDKSKNDALAKGVAILQGLWFIVQIVARFTQNLPVTQLEVTTLAFAVVNLLTWVLWWHKPLDVQRPILISSELDLLPRIKRHGNLLDEMNMVPLFGPDDGQHSEARPLMQSSAEGNDISTPTLAGAPVVSLGLALPRAGRRRLHFFLVDAFFWGAVHGSYPHYQPRSSTAVPAFWASPVEPGNTGFAGILTGVAFGVIHCIAWNAAFPSSVERILWRTSATAVAGIPSLIFILHGLGALFCGGHTHDHVPVEVRVLQVALYSVLRVILIVLPFTALRAVDPGWLIEVDWTIHILHF
ncbi:hypothetical protein MSAN_01824500 [Mycena sanguinolenta]|uniref:Uncharacterized protein n=1 Tax=Mycena sanguinolenta TaxID=230812 RepID=A0A8H6XUY7_9AGAR|nr:hypothetical protein MSAN_01824500 [Mycena sanguinolenta]